MSTAESCSRRKPGFAALRWGRSKSIRLWTRMKSAPLAKPSSLVSALAKLASLGPIKVWPASELGNSTRPDWLRLPFPSPGRAPLRDSTGADWNPRRLTRSSGLDQLRFGRGSGVRCLACAPRLFPAAPPSPAGCCGASYCLKIRPGLNGPKPTAHEYLSFPCLLIPKNERT